MGAPVKKAFLGVKTIRPRMRSLLGVVRDGIGTVKTNCQGDNVVQKKQDGKWFEQRFGGLVSASA